MDTHISKLAPYIEIIRALSLRGYSLYDLNYLLPKYEVQDF